VELSRYHSSFTAESKLTPHVQPTCSTCSADITTTHTPFLFRLVAKHNTYHLQAPCPILILLLTKSVPPSFPSLGPVSKLSYVSYVRVFVTHFSSLVLGARFSTKISFFFQMIHSCLPPPTPPIPQLPWLWARDPFVQGHCDARAHV
jgi:hypothetical protein